MLRSIKSPGSLRIGCAVEGVVSIEEGKGPLREIKNRGKTFTAL